MRIVTCFIFLYIAVLVSIAYEGYCLSITNDNDLSLHSVDLTNVTDLIVSCHMLPQVIDKTHMSKLISLTVNDGLLRTLPDSIYNMTNVEYLTLSGIGLEILPDGIENLRKLRIINLTYNKLQSFPLGLCKLTGIEAIALSGNNLTIIPKEVYQLKKLKSIWLNSNNIITVPAELFELDNIIYIDLNGNKISELPVSITNAYQLKTLCVSGNPISKYPKEMQRMRSLKRLYVGKITNEELNNLTMMLPFCEIITSKEKVSRTESNGILTIIRQEEIERHKQERIKGVQDDSVMRKTNEIEIKKDK